MAKKIEFWLAGSAILLALTIGLLYALMSAEVYFARVFFFQYAIFFPILIGLIFIALVIRLFLQPESEKLACFSIVTVILACIFSGVGLLPQFLVDFRHLDSLQVEDQTYRIGATMAMDGDNYIWLYRCGFLTCDKITDQHCSYDFRQSDYQLEQAGVVLNVMVDGEIWCDFNLDQLPN